MSSIPKPELIVAEIAYCGTPTRVFTRVELPLKSYHPLVAMFYSRGNYITTKLGVPTSAGFDEENICAVLEAPGERLFQFPLDDLFAADIKRRFAQRHFGEKDMHGEGEYRVFRILLGTPDEIFGTKPPGKRQEEERWRLGESPTMRMLQMREIRMADMPPSWNAAGRLYGNGETTPRATVGSTSNQIRVPDMPTSWSAAGRFDGNGETTPRATVGSTSHQRRTRERSQISDCYLLMGSVCLVLPLAVYVYNQVSGFYLFMICFIGIGLLASVLHSS